ncbi:MAG: hypothetical protein ASUL_07814 [Candidatus Aramenus sulfurataquae]|uniref:Uncharacterized protein n=1 Tax=Candidatus Aramenus sulfurataquae TaxID=1326980 RepID=W7KUC8_9CREN|nr:MAG: hypothetical protein ASUL_07814 [Candidatus Aramenus sulfurataquae]
MWDDFKNTQENIYSVTELRSKVEEVKITDLPEEYLKLEYPEEWKMIQETKKSDLRTSLIFFRN